MRPIYLPVKKKPDVIYQENGNVTPEEPEIVSNGVPKEDYRVAVSNLISKFETNSTPSPKKPSLMKSKSFSVRGSKKEPRINQTQDDALHNKTDAEVEEIRKLGVRDLRRKFEEVENNTDNSITTPERTHIKSEEKISPIENIARLRLEHFKRLTKKWERHVGELLRYLTETSDFDIYNVRVQDLELSINREFHAMKVNPEDVNPQEYTTPQKKPPEIEPLSHVAKITSLYEIKSKENIEEKPRTPTQIPKRLPWTTGSREKKKEAEKQIEEDDKFQEAVVAEEVKPEKVVVEESKPEKKPEEPSNLVDTEHLKSASLITSYFNSLSNVNNRNNDTSRLNGTKEKQTPSPPAEEISFGYPEQSSVLEPEENYVTFNESNKAAENDNYESTNESKEEQSEQLDESSNPHDSTIDREFEKYYSEDLKATGSEERLFEDYYRENVLEDAIPEESDGEIRAEYEGEAEKSYFAAVNEDEAEEDHLIHEAKVVEANEDDVHQSEVQEISAIENEMNGDTATKNIVEETAEEEAHESRSAVVEENEIGEDNSNTYLKNNVESNGSEKESLTQEATEEDFENRVTNNIVVVDHLPQELQKHDELVAEVQNEDSISQYVVEEPKAENFSVDENALQSKQDEDIEEERSQDSEEAQRNEAFKITEHPQENENATPENENSKSNLETLQTEEESDSIHKHFEKNPHEKAHVEEIAPVMRRHHDHPNLPEKDHPAAVPVEESCLRKYIVDTNDFINHEKTTS